MAITPYLLYRDAEAALDWLERAFGLRRGDEVFRGADGRVNHASMTLGRAILLLGSPGSDFKNPKVLGHVTQNLYVDVADADAHYERAVRAGAKIIEEPKDTFYGARRYGAEDLEGHHWYFAQALTAERKSTKRKAKRELRRKRRTGRSARK